MRNAALLLLCTFVFLAVAGEAFAAQPRPWEMDLQPAATDIMASIRSFEEYTLYIVAAIVALVMALIGFCIFRFNARANPVPHKTTHNTTIEVIWTVVPVLILVAIAIPSFRLLFYEETIPETDFTVKVTGSQWYWNYEYPTEGLEDINFTSYLLRDEQRHELMAEHGLTEEEVPRLLAVDYPMVVPVDRVVRVQVTASDVIHSFAMPSFGIKVDAVPGRLNELWFEAVRPGSYYGQCSELCGREHAYMPIEIRVLEAERFEQWAAAAKEDIDKANAMLIAWQTEQLEAPPVAGLADAGTPVARLNVEAQEELDGSRAAEPARDNGV